ncbi:MAG TPA: stage III sporulation protein AG [Clostridiales bacterium]|nr:stage III sporulation protein AG [Clostridiales bacterium]
MDKGFSFKELFKRLKKVQSIEYFIFILAIAIIVGVFGNWFQPRDAGQAASTSQEQPGVNDALQDERDVTDHEKRLKQILSTIKGAGRVEVMITYKTGKELVPAMNTIESSTETEEKDSNGGIRRVSQTDINTQPVSMTTSEGTQPLITREIQPEVLGVIVVAEGAGDIRVRMELQKAVQTVLGVQANQVDIFVMEDN